MCVCMHSFTVCILHVYVYSTVRLHVCVHAHALTCTVYLLCAKETDRGSLESVSVDWSVLNSNDMFDWEHQGKTGH